MAGQKSILAVQRHRPESYCWLQITMEIAHSRRQSLLQRQLNNLVEQGSNSHAVVTIFKRVRSEILSRALSPSAAFATLMVRILPMVFLVLAAKHVELAFRTGNFFPTLATLSHNQSGEHRSASHPSRLHTVSSTFVYGTDGMRKERKNGFHEDKDNPRSCGPPSADKL